MSRDGARAEAALRPWLAAAGRGLPEAVLARVLASLSAGERMTLDEHWPIWRREPQREPPGDWRVWLIMAGRGFGKTRAGAEWVSEQARLHPEARIALVGATAEEVAKVMVTGQSGLIPIARTGETPEWLAAKGELRFPSGATAFAYSGAKGDKLRGPEHHFAWCDELAKWGQAQSAWDNLMLGLRLGEAPRAVVTTTPKPIETLKAIIGLERTAVTHGTTRDNPHLPEDFLAAVSRIYGGTRLGRQELGGELIEEVEDALWTRTSIARARAEGPLPRFRRVVIGVDPPAGSGGDACGIVACGLDEAGGALVLADLSVAGLAPQGWAMKVAAAAEAWGAHRVVAEANNGGKMVEAVLRGASVTLPVRLVHAAESKAARAEPVAALFESGLARFAGRFPELEDELCGIAPAGRYAGPGRSPDRADAMVWALSELMLGRGGADPRVIGF
jgi:phage terminase large subunit-like protein